MSEKNPEGGVDEIQWLTPEDSDEATEEKSARDASELETARKKAEAARIAQGAETQPEQPLSIDYGETEEAKIEFFAPDDEEDKEQGKAA